MFLPQYTNLVMFRHSYSDKRRDRTLAHNSEGRGDVPGVLTTALVAALPVVWGQLLLLYISDFNYETL